MAAQFLEHGLDELAAEIERLEIATGADPVAADVLRIAHALGFDSIAEDGWELHESFRDHFEQLANDDDARVVWVLSAICVFDNDEVARILRLWRALRAANELPPVSRRFVRTRLERSYSALGWDEQACMRRPMPRRPMSRRAPASRRPRVRSRASAPGRLSGDEPDPDPDPDPDRVAVLPNGGAA